MALEGKGFYIWKILYCEAGDIGAIVSLAQQARLSHVLIKIANGTYGYNIDSDGNDLVPPLVGALNEANIEAWGWHYVYGDNPIGEANKAVQRIEQTNVSGYVIDAEREYKQPGKDQAAINFISRLRSVYPSLTVALSSYRFPSYHPNIPWEEFLEGCDISMPQVYWVLNHNPRDQLIRTVNEYQAITPSRPIIPTGSAYKAGGWAVTPEDIVEFLDTAKSLNLSAANFWEWSHTRKYLPEVWEAISDYTWFDTPPPLDIAQEYIAALNTHDVNQVLDLYTPTAIHVNALRTIQGSASLRAWYLSFLNHILANADFTLTNYAGTGSNRHLSWTASSSTGDVLNGDDTFGLINGKIAYHYTYFNVT